MSQLVAGGQDLGRRLLDLGSCPETVVLDAQVILVHRYAEEAVLAPVGAPRIPGTRPTFN